MCSIGLALRLIKLVQFIAVCVLSKVFQDSWNVLLRVKLMLLIQPAVRHPASSLPATQVLFWGELPVNTFLLPNHVNLFFDADPTCAHHLHG